MEPVRPSHSKLAAHSPLHVRQRPVCISPPSREELKQMFEKQAEDLHCHLLKEAFNPELEILRKREVELRQTVMELKQVVAKQARIIVAVKRENHELKGQLTHMQQVVSENEELLLAMQLSSLGASNPEPNPVDVDHMSYEQLLALEEEMGSVSTGLSPQAIEALEVYKVTREMKEQTPTCAICMHEHGLYEQVLVLPQCGHFYHQPCIQQWLSKKNRCPVCQTTVV